MLCQDGLFTTIYISGVCKMSAFMGYFIATGVLFLASISMLWLSVFVIGNIVVGLA